MSRCDRRQQRRMLAGKLRKQIHAQRARNRAQRCISAGQPQSAKTWLLATGLPFDTADRFAGAFSRSVIPSGTTQAKVKLRRGSRKTKRVSVKLYDQATFIARLATYRPRDKEAAREFDRIAA